MHWFWCIIVCYLQSFLTTFREYAFLWIQDVQRTFEEFLAGNIVAHPRKMNRTELLRSRASLSAEKSKKERERDPRYVKVFFCLSLVAMPSWPKAYFMYAPDPYTDFLRDTTTAQLFFHHLFHKPFLLICFTYQNYDMVVVFKSDPIAAQLLPPLWPQVVPWVCLRRLSWTLRKWQLLKKLEMRKAHH